MMAAQKMQESMDELQVDYFALPDNPIFFKACNRTYFLSTEKVF
jgi:hypothetical protein